MRSVCAGETFAFEIEGGVKGSFAVRSVEGGETPLPPYSPSNILGYNVATNRPDESALSVLLNRLLLT